MVHKHLIMEMEWLLSSLWDLCFLDQKRQAWSSGGWHTLAPGMVCLRCEFGCDLQCNGDSRGSCFVLGSQLSTGERDRGDSELP